SSAAVFCASYNAAVCGCEKCCTFHNADVTLLKNFSAGSVVHLDPDRRVTGRRSASLADYSPGPRFVEELIRQPGLRGVIKLSPAMPKDELAALCMPLDIEYVSTHNTCRQLLAWFPAVGEGSRLATVIRGEYPDYRVDSVFAAAGPAAYGAAAGKYLIEPDAAVLAAGAESALAMKLSAWKLAPGLVWLFADKKPATDTAGQIFEIIQSVPGRLDDIKKALKNLNAGNVELKTRGVDLNADKVQRQLHGKGTQPLTVLWGRVGLNQLAFIAKR
ncbi:MAG TPA: hypothetical protein PLK08_00155, partial [Phycisphaerae bacterium]|nr:hypothetical protein [Phycisphaerae bacterium]